MRLSSDHSGPAKSAQRLLRIDEVSLILRIPEQEVIRLINARILARAPPRRGYLVADEQLRAFLAATRISHAP